jgi:hypothetical protein
MLDVLVQAVCGDGRAWSCRVLHKDAAGLMDKVWKQNAEAGAIKRV